MGDQLVSMLNRFFNNPVGLINEHIKSGRYDLDVIYFKRTGYLSGKMGKSDVFIHFTDYESEEKLTMMIDGKLVRGFVTIDMINAFAQTGQLLAGVTLVPTLPELIDAACNMGGVSAVRFNQHDFVVVVSADHCINQNATVLYVTDHDKANAVAESFIDQSYQAEVLPLKMNTTQFILKCIAE